MTKGTNLSRPQLQAAAINLLSLGNSVIDTSRILGISTYLVRSLAKGATTKVNIGDGRRVAKESPHEGENSD